MNYQLKDIVKGDRKATKQFYYEYAPRLLAVCKRYTQSTTLAEDLMHESLLEIIKSLKNFDATKGELYPWMKKITIRYTFKHLKRARRLDIQSLDYALDIPSDYTEILDEIGYKEILSKVNKLPSGYREVFNLAVIDGLSHKEIAENLDISILNSRTILTRARKMLIKALNSQNLYIKSHG